MTSTLVVPDADERNDLGAFVARVVRLDPAATVRIRQVGGRVDVWATTPFDVLATRSAHGAVEPADVTTAASALLTALAVDRSPRVDPGPPALWPAEVPDETGWRLVDEVPAAEVDALAERGLALARVEAGPHGPPASLLDQIVLTVSAPGTTVKVPMRCLFALSGMGFIGTDDTPVRVLATSRWLRLDARFGAVVRRRTTALPLLLA